MPESLEVERVPLMFKGVFDMHSIYEAIMNWNKKYGCRVFETLYKDKISGPGVREIDIFIDGFVKMNEWLKWETKVILRGWDIKEVKQTNAQGVPLVQGRMEIIIMSKLVRDYQQTYGGTSYARYLGKLLHTLWSKGTLSDKYGEAIVKQFELQNECRRILGIETHQG